MLLSIAVCSTCLLLVLFLERLTFVRKGTLDQENKVSRSAGQLFLFVCVRERDVEVYPSECTCSEDV